METILFTIDKFKQIIDDYNQDNNTTQFLESMNKLNITFSTFGLKEIRDLRNSEDPVNQIISKISSVPIIQNRNILYDERFVQQFYNIFWNIIRTMGLSTENFYEFVPSIISALNKFTTDDYFISDCRSTDNYNCGRAMIIIGLYPTRFLIFNTDSNAKMDPNTQMEYLKYIQGLCVNQLSNDPNTVSDNDFDSLEKSGLTGRLSKELQRLSDKYQISIKKEKHGWKVLLKNNTDSILFNIPTDYPQQPPSGIFNGLTISDTDINLGDTWFPSNNLTQIIDRLVDKSARGLMPVPRVLKVPTKERLEKICK